MKLLTHRGKKLTKADINMPGVVLQCTAPGVYTIRCKPIYPKGFAALARDLWKEEPLELRKDWKRLLSGGNPRKEPIWAYTIDIYRAVLYLRLLNNERLHAGAPKRLPALKMNPHHGIPACNYASLPDSLKLELRTRIDTFHAEFKRQAEAKRTAQQSRVSSPTPARQNSSHPSPSLQAWMLINLPPLQPAIQHHPYTRRTPQSITPLRVHPS